MADAAPEPSFQWIVRATAITLILLGLMVLAGWLTGVRALQSVLPGTVPMKANTATGFVGCGAALLLVLRPSVASRGVARLLAVGIFLLGAASAFEAVAGVDLGIDQALFRDDPAAAPGRMAVLTSGSFALAAIGLLLAGRGQAANRWVGGLALAIAFVGYALLVGYAFGGEGLSRENPLGPMAFPTALGFLLLALGLLATGGPTGLLRYVAGSRGAADVALPVIAAALALPIASILAIRWSGGLDSVGLSVAALSVAASSHVTVGLTAVLVRRLDRSTATRQEADARYRLLADNVEDMVVQAEASGPWRYASPSSAKLLGYPPDELLGKRTADLIHPEDRDRVAAERGKMVRSGVTVPLQMRLRRKDGSYVWVESRTSPLRDPSGKVTGLVSVVRDVAERKQAEDALQASEEKYRKLSASLEEQVARRVGELSAANKELEAFAYSVSHDLRAPLRSLDGFSKILLEEYRSALPEEGQHYLKMVMDSASEMAQLVDALLGFSRAGRQELKRERVGTAQLVNDVLAELKPSWGDRPMQVQVAGLPEVEADPVLLRQVFMNLLSNAVKFTRGREPAIIQVDASRAEGDVVFSVKDNGIGFDMAYADKLFGIFQRLHRAEEFEGNGVGLAIVQRIIQRHGGRVWAEAEPGRGARFFFTLPGGNP